MEKKRLIYLPKWIGTNNIVSSLDSLGSIPDTLNTEYSKVFEVSSYTTLASDDTAYEGLIDKAPTSDGTDGLYIPVDATGVYPAYIKGFASTSAQYYQSLLEEYNTIIKSNIANINNLKTTVEGIQSSTALGSTLNTYKSTFGSIQSAIADVGDPAIDFKVRDKAFDLFLLSFKILYGVFLALAACLITLISLYVWLRFTILKLPTHIVWNVAMLICFLTLLVGSILGIVSYIFAAISPVMTYLFSKEFLSNPSSKFFQEGGTPNYIDICLNGNGDLSTELGANTSPEAQKLEEFNTLAKAIQRASAATPDSCSSYSTVLTEWKTYEQDMSKATTSSDGTNDIQTAINAINVVARGGGCSDSTGPVHHYYTTTTCPSPFDKNENRDNKCVIFSIDNTPLPTYTSCTVQDKIDYISSVYTHYKDRKAKLLSDQSSCIALLTKIKTVYKNSNAMTKSVTDVSSSSVGPDSKLFSMFNCKFLSHDLIQFRNQFHNKFYPAFKDVAISCVVGSVFSYAAVYFLIRTLYHFGPSESKNFPKQSTKIESELVNINSK